MKNQNLFTQNSIFKEYLKKGTLKKTSKNFDKVFKNFENEINNIKKTQNILSKDYRYNINFKNLNKFKNYQKIVLIGMGGSILGSEAIKNFLQKKIKKKVYFFNNLDLGVILKLKKKENLNKILFLVISKSGNTIETLSNLFSLNIIKKNSKNILIISQKNTILYSLAKKYNLFFIEHKKSVGGRYSVLSEAGLVPAYLMGISPVILRSKIRRFLKGKEKLFLKESVIKLATLINNKSINSLIFLNYCPELEKFVFWAQQLIAESLGKKGKGYLPMLSNAPKDHHSLLQLYLDGQKDKLFIFLSFEDKTKHKIKIKKFVDKKHFLEGKNINTIKNAQKNALIQVFKKNKIPFRDLRIKRINEQVLGELFSYFIIETIIIGKLTNINPFDQPAVEKVKVYTKKLLI